MQFHCRLHLIANTPTMPTSMQLQIPTPCMENWSAMDPVEKGRHCAACQKTVIDFTGMSDAEVVRTISQAGAQVCGRLAPDQLNRKLSDIPPVQRNGGSGWRWLLTGLLLTADPPARHQPRSVGMVDIDRKEKHVQYIDESITMGIPFTKIVAGKLRPTYFKDSSAPLMGAPKLEIDSSDMAIKPPTDSVALPKAMENGGQELEGFVGGISVGVAVKADTISLLKQLVADTLATLRILSKKEFSVYPNPVNRGAGLRIEWNATPGSYRLVLYNASGMMMKDKEVEVAGPGQVDSWELPLGITGGSYVIRAVRADGTAAFSRILVVL